MYVVYVYMYMYVGSIQHRGIILAEERPHQVFSYCPPSLVELFTNYIFTNYIVCKVGLNPVNRHLDNDNGQLTSAQNCR